MVLNYQKKDIKIYSLSNKMLQYNCDQTTNFVNIEPQKINFNNETFLKIEATLRMCKK